MCILCIFQPLNFPWMHKDPRMIYVSEAKTINSILYEALNFIKFIYTINIKHFKEKKELIFMNLFITEEQYKLFIIITLPYISIYGVDRYSFWLM